jgi:hypothetical protein
MPAFGIIELISLLLGLAGFGLHPDPKPATADSALEYAVVDPDMVVHIDAEAIVPGNYKALMELPSQPQIKNVPDVAAIVRKAIGEVEGGRGLAKQATGIDFTQDVTDATAFMQLVPHGDMNFLAAVHGKFSTANVDKIAATVNRRATPIGAGAWVEVDNKTAVGVTKDHVLLAGTTPWVRDRMADNWKPPTHAAGTSLGYAAAMIDGKPVFAWSVTLSPSARQEMTRKLDAPNFLTDLVMRHKAASVSLYADGLGWTWVDSTRAGLESMATISDGVIDLMRASQIAPRGVAKIALGGLESYKADKRVEEILRHKDDLMKIVAMYTGDGNFKVKVDKDPAKLSLSVRATGKTASEVVPLGMLAPFAALGFFMEAHATSGATSVSVPATSYPPPPPMPMPPPATGKRP